MGRSEVEQLRRRLAHLEAEYARVCDQVAKESSASETVLPGLFLCVRVGKASLLVPASMVGEVVRVVACAPVPAAAAHVLGSFLYRGTPAVAIDLARLFGSELEHSVDARMLVLQGSQVVGLVVERVSSLVSDPVIADWNLHKDELKHCGGGEFVSGLCHTEGAIVPLLNVERVLAGADVPGAEVPAA